MPRHRSYETIPDGPRWVRQLAGAQRKVEKATGDRDQLVHEALDAGLSAGSVAEAIHADKATVWRRYVQRKEH